MLSKVVETMIQPAYARLPVRMASPAATAMLLAIGLQESRFQHRKQLGGPARGYWQFEPLGGVWGVRQHRETSVYARKVLVDQGYDPRVSSAMVCAMLAVDHVLAAAFARLLLWTLPDPLPGAGAPEEGWRQYIAAWRPGKPHRHTWDKFYSQAWAKVGGAP